MSSAAQSALGDRLVKVGLTAGFAALAVATLIAHAAPARGYELSIYTATPAEFWLGGGVVLVIVGVVVAMRAVDPRLRALTLVLAGMTTLAVVVLPLIRGYYFFGGADSLTHLGWVKDIAGGALDPFDLLYPGDHLFAVLLSEGTGVPLRRSLMFVPAAFALIYFLFVPLTLREVVDADGWPVVIGAISAFMLLPINNLSVHMNPHPISQSILLSPLVIYLVFRYARAEAPPEAGSNHWFSPTMMGSLLGLTSIALVVYHPQHAMTLAALLTTLCLVQFGYRFARPEHPLSDQRPLYGQTAVLVTATLLWTVTHPGIGRLAGNHLQELLQFVLQSGQAPAGETVTTQSNSLSEAGGGIAELLLKLSLVDLVYVALSVGVVTAWLLRFLDTRDTDPEPTYLIAGGVPVFGIFLGLFAIGKFNLYARYSGFLLVIATILGASVLAIFFNNSTSISLRLTASVALVGLLVLSMAVVFSSPYIFLQSDHVSERQMDGHETAFEHRVPETTISGIRGGPWRYGHAVDGTVAGVDGSRYTAISGETLEQGVVGEYEDDRYLRVTRTDRRRELGAYNGVRYSEESFRAVRNSPGIHRVQSNGGFVLYLVESRERAPSNSG